jgi:yeast amino acid transporter
MIGMLVPYDDTALLAKTGTAAESPWVIALNRAGVKGMYQPISNL